MLGERRNARAEPKQTCISLIGVSRSSRPAVERTRSRSLGSLISYARSSICIRNSKRRWSALRRGSPGSTTKTTNKIPAPLVERVVRADTKIGEVRVVSDHFR
jgi:hypothetical protein